MGFLKIGWLQKKEDEKANESALILEEVQGIKKVLRKQSLLMEEMRNGQEAAASVGRDRRTDSAVELCDAVFHLKRAFRHPGFMSCQHAQALDMVMKKAAALAVSLGLEMILEEGIPFDPGIHEVLENRSAGSDCLDVLEVIQPGYLLNGKVIRPARVVVGAPAEGTCSPEGIA